MFYHLNLLNPQHRMQLHLPWKAATIGIRSIKKDRVLQCDTIELCRYITQFIVSDSTNPKKRFSLRMATIMVHGTVIIWRHQVLQLEREIHSQIHHNEDFVKKREKEIAAILNEPEEDSEEVARLQVPVPEGQENLVPAVKDLFRRRIRLKHPDVPDLAEKDFAAVQAHLDNITLKDGTPSRRQAEFDDPDFTGAVHVDETEKRRTTKTARPDAEPLLPAPSGLMAEGPAAEFVAAQEVQAAVEEAMHVTAASAREPLLPAPSGLMAEGPATGFVTVQDVQAAVEEAMHITAASAREVQQQNIVEEPVAAAAAAIPKKKPQKSIAECLRIDWNKKMRYRPSTRPMQFYDEEDAKIEHHMELLEEFQKLFPLDEVSDWTWRVPMPSPAEFRQLNWQDAVSTPLESSQMEMAAPSETPSETSRPSMKRPLRLTAELEPVTPQLDEINMVLEPQPQSPSKRSRIGEDTPHVSRPVVDVPVVETTPEIALATPASPPLDNIKWYKEIMAVLDQRSKIKPVELCTAIGRRVNRRNMAVLFNSLLALVKQGYVLLHSAPDSLELDIIEKC